jgi:peptidoglycan/LPS O-acetylase OafA/YrhL
MGVVRLMLSLLVVGSHVGGMGEVPSGTTAIAGFFTISGFLMARTIFENYSTPGRRLEGATRFYVNRFVRIVPPFAAVALLTFGLLWIRAGRGFQNLLEDGVVGGDYMPVDVPTSPMHLISLGLTRFPVFSRPNVALLPQAWSLVTETAFYLIAPLLFLSFTSSRMRTWNVAIPLLSVYLAFLARETNWLRSAPSALWVFWLGMQTYFLVRDREHTSPVRRRIAVVPAVLVALIGCGLMHVPERAAMFVVPILTAAWLALGEWDTRQMVGFDRQAGNISYGIFLAHFLSTMSMYWIAEAVYAHTGVFGIFGIPDVAEVRLRVSSFLFAIVFGTLIYVAFERPFERLRASLRRRRRSHSAIEVVAVTTAAGA